MTQKLLVKNKSRSKRPHIFISHDSLDSVLARHFVDLLAGATAGMLASFCSSDTRGDAGIKYGDEWYQTIMENLRTANDVVVLLTQNSLNSPWVLYEAGVAKGLDNATVFGVTLGIPLAQVATGPFAQFQNCADDEDSLTQLVIRLIQWNLQTQPHEGSIRQLVQQFRKRIEDEVPNRPSPQPQAASQDVFAKLLEEVKLIPRRRRRNWDAKLLGPKLFVEFPLVSADRKEGYDATGWLMFIGILRDELPWLYELGLELYRALGSGDREWIEGAQERILRSVRTAAENKWLRSVLGEGNPELSFLLFHLPDLMESYLSQLSNNPNMESYDAGSEE